MNVKSFVFLDSETTGLPAHEYNKTKITELCLISAQADHISLGVIPRVQNKITLCFNPQKRIQPAAESITGLYNDQLCNESAFNKTTVDILINFLERLQKPICFVAHNGFRFDYPILRNHVENVGTTFSDDILCIDSLRAFKEILNKQNTTETIKIETNASVVTEIKSEASSELNDDWDEVLYNEVLKIETSLQTPDKSIQILNETTPPVKKTCQVPAAPKHRRIRDGASTSNAKPNAQRRLDFDEKKPRQSFKLGDIYTRLTEKSPTDAHQAEEDVKMLLECAVHLGDIFIEYVNENAVPFNTIPKMQPGVKMGDIP